MWRRRYEIHKAIYGKPELLFQARGSQSLHLPPNSTIMLAAMLRQRMVVDMQIILDVTGFYFSTTVDIDNPKTVQEIMEKAALQTASQPTKLDFGPRLDAARGAKLNFIQVVFDGQPPVSRQKRPGGGVVTKVDRKYIFDDTAQVLTGPTNLGQAQYQLAWQYYVSDKTGRIRNGTPATGGDRTIVPFSVDAKEYAFEDGDVVTWRLVGIFSQDAPKDTTGRAHSTDVKARA